MRDLEKRIARLEEVLTPEELTITIVHHIIRGVNADGSFKSDPKEDSTRVINLTREGK